MVVKIVLSRYPDAFDRTQWQTTWDRSKLLTRTSDPLINFVTKGAIGDADIVVNDGAVYQQMDGFGATLSTYTSASWRKSTALLTLSLNSRFIGTRAEQFKVQKFS